MSTSATRTGTAQPRAQKAPSVLVILVVKDGEAWVRAALSALARQDYPRIGVVAVDNASTDQSADILETTLGEARVLRLDENVGFPAAIERGIERAGAAAGADYLLLLHDDAVMAPDAISRMVELAERIAGAGVIGPKLVDWDDPTILREVGLSADRFGYPYSPLEEEELDQGQYDRAREVLFVTSAAMLVSRDAWRRAGLPDERYGSHHEDLDFCWRVRLAGFRVLMNPAAVARHRAASVRAEREGGRGASRDRYYRERAALASLLKNYSLLTLLWMFPLYVVQGVGKVVLFLGERRFSEAWQVLAAWGWNLRHLPGTFRRRVRSQGVRAVPDRDIRRFMAPAAYRARRFLQQFSGLLWGREGRLEEDEVLERPSIRARATSYAARHPVVVAWVAAAVLSLLAYRNLLGARPLEGGALAAMPEGASSFLRAFTSGVRTTALGGVDPASPALVAFGAGSFLSFNSPALFQKLLLLTLPLLAGLSMYRTTVRITASPGPAAVAAGAYALSAVALSAFSTGRLDLLALVAITPWLGSRLWVQNRSRVSHPVRWMVGTGMGIAVAAAFYPGAFLVVALLLLVSVVVPAREPGARIGYGVGALVVAAILLFPNVIQLASDPSGLGEVAGRAPFGELARLAIGPGAGAWLPALYLPIAAGLGLAFIAPPVARMAGRGLVAAVAGLGLAWASAAGYLPPALTNAPAYLVLTAFAYATLLALALASMARGVDRQAFGAHQLGYVLIAVLVTVGLLAQAFEVVRAPWAIGEDRRAAAWPVVDDTPAGERFRILWVGRRENGAFPAPGGVPQGVVEAGRASVRYAVTDRGGVSAYDVGRAAPGPGYAALRTTLAGALDGDVRHLGALLAAYGIRFVVSAPGDLPAAAVRRLGRQVDLGLIQTAGGLTIFRVAADIPPEAAVTGADWVAAAVAADALRAAGAEPPQARLLAERGESSFTGEVAPGEVVYVADQLDGAWRIDGPGGSAGPERAFGWAMLFRPPPGVFTVEFGRQWLRTVQVLLLLLLWVGAAWVTRRAARGPVA